MQITPDPDLRQAALDALRKEYGLTQHRSGLHQSELSYCLTKSYWDRSEYYSPPTEHELKLFTIGFALERVMLRPHEEQPPEIVIDGISMSLDTINLFGPADLKSTRMSPNGRKGEDGFQFPNGWVKQFAAYCKALGILSFGVVVVHLIQPEIAAWRIQFTQEELDDHWGWLLDRSNQLESMLNSRNPAPFETNEEYECAGCRYKLLCELTASKNRLMNTNVIQFPHARSL